MRFDMNYQKVRIDRCVSKNIFIGVVTADARLDNYVGCDRYGYATKVLLYHVF